MTILTAVLLALQADPPSPPQDARVAAYVQQLRDDATRDRARDRLIHIGKSVLPALEKSEADPALLASIRQEIALNETLSSSYGPPHTFTFDGTEEGLGVLLSRLESEARMPLQKNSLDLGQKIPLKLEDATFWESLDELCKKAGIFYWPGTDPIYLNGGNASLKPRAYYGPVMLVVDRMIQQRLVTFDRINSEFLIRVMCVWEKSISPMGPTGRYKLLRVLDDTGASLLPEAAPAAAAKPVMPMRLAGQTIDLAGLRPPSPDARKLTVVEGTLELEFPARIDEVRIEIQVDMAPATKELEGATVEVRSFSPQSTWGAAADVQIRFADPKEAANFRIGASDTEFRGVGDPKQGWIGSTIRVPEKNAYNVTVHWRNPGRQQENPKEIRLRIPRGSVIKNVPFCYRDMELK